jgi:hypothetical protein
VTGLGVASTVLMGAVLAGIALVLAYSQRVSPLRKQPALSTR